MENNEKINYLKKLVITSISINNKEKENILEYIKEKPEEIDNFIEIFREENKNIIKKLENYLN